MSISTYLTALDRDRDALAANLTTKGVTASSSETFTSLVPKVLDIPSGENTEFLENQTCKSTNPNLASGSNWGLFTNISTYIEKIEVPNLTFVDGMQLIGWRNLKEITFKNCLMDASSSSNTVQISDNNYHAQLLEKIVFDGCTFKCSNSTAYGSIEVTLDNSTYPKDGQIIFRNCQLVAGTNGVRATEIFEGRYIKSIDANGLDVTNATNFKKCFHNCSALTSLDLSSWNPTSIKNISQMFYGCSSLQTLDISGMNIPDLTSDYRSNTFGSVPTTCTIYVKDAAVQSRLSRWFSSYTFTVKS